jgi:hypothetical protein
MEALVLVRGIKRVITFESGIDKSVIDYLVVRRGDRSLLKNVRGIWGKTLCKSALSTDRFCTQMLGKM